MNNIHAAVLIQYSPHHRLHHLCNINKAGHAMPDQSVTSDCRLTLMPEFRTNSFIFNLFIIFFNAGMSDYPERQSGTRMKKGHQSDTGIRGSIPAPE
jgi:hypothetical protein